MREELAGAGFGQPHEVLDLQVVIQLGLFLGGKRRGFLAFDEIPHALTRGPGWSEAGHVARIQRGDKLDEFLVSSHQRNLAPPRRNGKLPGKAKRRCGDRGRDAGCPAPPAQIPACSIPAPGSSPSLARASARLVMLPEQLDLAQAFGLLFRPTAQVTHQPARPFHHLGHLDPEAA